MRHHAELPTEWAEVGCSGEDEEKNDAFKVQGPCWKAKKHMCMDSTTRKWQNKSKFSTLV